MTALSARDRLKSFLDLTENQLNKLLEDKNTPLFDKRLLETIKEGRTKELIDLLNQSYGKPKESLDLNTPPPVALVKFKKK